MKSSLSEDIVISMSCAASELPKYNCTLTLRRKYQDLGPIGHLKCDAKRPLITALANLTDSAFDELIKLVRISPPRQPAFYLKISDIQHFIDFGKKNEQNLKANTTNITGDNIQQRILRRQRKERAIRKSRYQQ